MSEIVLDTTFFVDLRRGRHAGAAELWTSIRSGEVDASYSPVTVYELWSGPGFNQDEEDFFDSILAVLSEAPLTASAAKSAGGWIRQIRGSISEALVRDALIAATAVNLGEQVCTLNRRDFLRFPVSVQSY